MSNQIVISSLYDQLVDHFSAGRDSGESLAEVQKTAFSYFKDYGFPTTKNEYWRFTNTRPFLNEPYQLDFSGEPDPDMIAKAEKEASIPDLDAYKIVLVNGSIHFGLSQLPDPELVSIQPVSQVRNSDFFLSAINKRLDLSDPQNAFSALNTAFFTDGYCIEVKAGVSVDKPIHVYQIFSSAENVLFHPRHLIWINKGASADIIETADCLGDAHYFINSVTDITIEKDAVLTHSSLQMGNKGERWINQTQVDQQGKSRYENYVYSLPQSALIRNNLNVELNDSHTETHMYGLYIAGKDQLVDNHSLVDHLKPKCESNQLYKGVVLDNGKGVFNGRIYVHTDAQKTNAYQSNKNMLFTSEGSIHTKPQLEIYADDVKCSHGTTIGQFDPMQLFYLQSRGIAESQARAMLVNAFAYDVTSKINNEPLRNYIEDKVQKTIAVAHYGE